MNECTVQQQGGRMLEALSDSIAAPRPSSENPVSDSASRSHSQNKEESAKLSVSRR